MAMAMRLHMSHMQPLIPVQVERGCILEGVKELVLLWIQIRYFDSVDAGISGTYSGTAEASATFIPFPREREVDSTEPTDSRQPNFKSTFIRLALQPGKGTFGMSAITCMANESDFDCSARMQNTSPNN
jgi:hypothetical protein